MPDAKNVMLVAALGLSLGACAPSTKPTMLPPPSNLPASDATDTVASDTKAFDFNDDGSATTMEVAGGVLAVGAVIALCPLCVFGM